MNIMNKTEGIIHSVDSRDGRICHQPCKKNYDKPETDENRYDILSIQIQKYGS